ncbi:hypothetical protein CSAL01_01029 [Colletotrichum salicis]|uniref:Uncharacterized protein n=1 Tax=Colletotrichum salicis TaxID=1209931 RepID=A0A135V5D3_9PEZI|nr:hypothetical protein CSAL01_01029 [Colletotrichum salicis]
MNYTTDLLFASAAKYARAGQSHSNDNKTDNDTCVKQIIVDGTEIPRNMTITKRGFLGLPFLAYMKSDSPTDVVKVISARDELDSWAHLIRQYKTAKSMFDLIRSCSSWIDTSQLDSSLEGLTQVKLAHAVHETLRNANFEWWATSYLYQFIDGTEIFESLEDREAFDKCIELRKESTLKLNKKRPSKRLGTTSSRPRVQKLIEGAARHTPCGRKTRNGTKKGKGKKDQGEPEGQVQISVAMLA